VINGGAGKEDVMHAYMHSLTEKLSMIEIPEFVDKEREKT